MNRRNIHRRNINRRNIHRRNIQGELFDCTIQSYNDNGHGTHKIDYSLRHGISISIQKYVEELRMISEDTDDDKSVKRRNRLEFLEYIKDQDVIVNYFQYFTTWLNGGSYFPDLDQWGTNFETNKLIMITAGGNIITIFAKLLQDLITNGRKPEIGFNQFIMGSWNLSGTLISLLATASHRLRELIYNISEYYFSDFDQNILPNKCNNTFEGNYNTNNNRMGNNGYGNNDNNGNNGNNGNKNYNNNTDNNNNYVGNSIEYINPKNSIIMAHKSNIRFLTLSQDGKFIASCSEKGTLIRIYNTDTKHIVKELRRGTDEAIINWICFNKDNTHLLCRSKKGTIHIFHTDYKEERKQNNKLLYITDLSHK